VDQLVRRDGALAGVEEMGKFAVSVALHATLVAGSGSGWAGGGYLGELARYFSVTG
jgi:hypothetical protein